MLKLFIFLEFPFDFVFLIPLRNVDRNCSLAKIVADEHDLERDDIDLLQDILKGKSEEKVLLLLDGYDEYTSGTNTELDRAIEKTLGTCLIILTFRPKEGKDFTENIRRKMHGEIVVEGFNEENIMKCCCRFLKSQSLAHKFLKEAQKRGQLYKLLKVPIMLLMTSVLFNEDESRSLPERKTQLYKDLYKFVMDRSTLKPHNFGCYSSEVLNLKEMLQTLRKFAFEALQNDVRQLLINKVLRLLHFNKVRSLIIFVVKKSVIYLHFKCKCEFRGPDDNILFSPSLTQSFCFIYQRTDPTCYVSKIIF